MFPLSKILPGIHNFIKFWWNFEAFSMLGRIWDNGKWSILGLGRISEGLVGFREPRTANQRGDLFFFVGVGSYFSHPYWVFWWCSRPWVGLLDWGLASWVFVICGWDFGVVVVFRKRGRIEVFDFGRFGGGKFSWNLGVCFGRIWGQFGRIW